MKKKPNFIIVGAQKAGTTSIFNTLSQHPDIYIPKVKECRYFSKINNKVLNPFNGKRHSVQVCNNTDDYYDLFDSCKNEKVISDISPDYLYYYKETIDNIKNEIGDSVKILIVLRNPIDRAISNYYHMLREGETDLTISEIIDSERLWDKNVWCGFRIVENGIYYDRVSAFIKSFKDVRVMFFEDLIHDSSFFYNELYSFIDVRNIGRVADDRCFKNKSGLVALHPCVTYLKNIKLLRSIVKMLATSILGPNRVDKWWLKYREDRTFKPQVDDKVKALLIELYSDDIRKLSSLIKRDLSCWLK